MDNRLSISSENRKRLLANFAMGKTNYWFTFVADTLSALFFLSWEYWHHHSNLGYIAAAFLLGHALWGLTEYVFHRWVYHESKGIFMEGHTAHHENPQVLIAMPWFMTTITIFSLWYLSAELLGIPFFSPVAAGWLIGFVGYSLVHHAQHHWDIRIPWHRKMTAYHNIHHKFPETNFGVTMRYWDNIFGTRFQKTKSESVSEKTAAL